MWIHSETRTRHDKIIQSFIVVAPLDLIFLTDDSSMSFIMIYCILRYVAQVANNIIAIMSYQNLLSILTKYFPGPFHLISISSYHFTCRKHYLHQVILSYRMSLYGGAGRSLIVLIFHYVKKLSWLLA